MSLPQQISGFLKVFLMAASWHNVCSDHYTSHVSLFFDDIIKDRGSRIIEFVDNVWL